MNEFIAKREPAPVLPVVSHEPTIAPMPIAVEEFHDGNVSQDIDIPATAVTHVPVSHEEESVEAPAEAAAEPEVPAESSGIDTAEMTAKSEIPAVSSDLETAVPSVSPHVSANVTLAQAAEAAGLSENYISKLVRSGEIASVLSGDEARIPEDSLNEFITRRAKRLEERRARLAQERAIAYSPAAGETEGQKPALSPIQNVVSDRRPVSWRTERIRQLSMFVVALVVGGSIFVLANATPRTTAFTNTAHDMLASASETVGGLSHSIFADLARAVNADVNSLFYVLVGKPGTVATAVDTQVKQTPTPLAVAPAQSAPVQQVPTKTASVSTPAPVINQTIIQQPVIERIVQTSSAFAGVSQQSLEEQLQQLDNKLSSRMYGLSSANSTSIAQNYNVTAQTNAIDQLTNTRITNPTITGGSITDTAISARSLSVSSDVTFGNIVITNATTTNLAVTGLMSLGNTTVDGDLTLTGALNFSGSSSTISANGGTFTNSTSTNGYFTSLTAASATTTGSHYIGGNLTVGGNSIVLGTSTSNTLAINSSINSHLVPSQNATYDLGSASYYWRNAYVGTLNANNISAASSSIGGTNSQTFTINAGNATADTQDMNLVFFRGTVVPNAVISWNSALNAKRFEFNQPIYVSNQSGSTTQTTLTLKGLAGQTGNLFSIASSTGSNMFTIGSDGSVTISTSTITSLTSGTTTLTNLSVTNTNTSSFAGALTVGGTLGVTGNTTLANATTTNLFSTTASSTNLYATNSNIGVLTAGTLNLTGGFVSQASSTVVGNFTSTGIGSFLSGAFTGTTGTTTIASGQGFAVGSSQLVVQQGSGNVGIGTTSPYSLLSISNSATTPANTPLFTIASTTGGTSTSTLLTVLSGGQIVVGKTTAFANTLVDINGTLNTNNLTVNQTNLLGNGNSYSYVRGASGQGVEFLVNGAVNAAGAAGASAVITSAGNFGIGTTSPWKMLSVAGDIIGTNLTATGTLAVAGDTTLANATSTNFFSTTASSTNLFSQLAGVGTLTLGTKLTVANGGTGVGTLTGVAIGNGTSAFTAGSAQTCTNQFVRAMSAAYVATCATVNLATDITGTLAVANGGTGITSFGAGIATFLGTPTSANLAAALTDETGTGAAVFAGSPTLTGTLTAAAANFSGTVGVTGSSIPVGTDGGNQSINSTDSQAADLGGSLALGGKYDTTSTLTFAKLSGRKENSTSGDWSGYLQFSTRLFGGALAERMRITSSGNVAIGTTTAAAKLSIGGGGSIQLDIGSNDGIFQTALTSHVAGNAGSIGLGINDGGGNAGVFVNNAFGYSGFTGFSSQYITFKTAAGGSFASTERMRIDPSGNVSIGTSTPYAKFTVWGTGTGTGVLSQWVNSASTTVARIFENGTSYFLGNVGIGTTTSSTKLGVQDPVSSGQLALAYDALDSSILSTNSLGNLIVLPSGNNMFLPNTNLWVCTGGSISSSACPSGTPTGQGNLIVQNKIGVASSTPFSAIAVGAGGAITTTEKSLTDSATITIDWTQGNQQLVTLAGNRTIAFTNYIPGAALRLIACQDATGSRTLTWPAVVLWSGGTAPTLTTTASKCDVFTFVATSATGTVKVLGSSVLSF